MTSFSILNNIGKKTQEKISLKVLNTFENIAKNVAFALLEQLFHFPYYFQIDDISKALKGFIIE